MMKKGSILFLILTLILSSFSVVSAASGTDQVMASFNIMPLTCSADSDNLVTRRDFAYTIANILGSGEMEARDTEYVDVAADMEDSGYIYFATVNGFLIPNGTLFCPDDPISFHDYNAAVVKLLAYEAVALSNGGGDAGNMKTVMDLYLYNGVSATNYDTVTVKQYRQLIYNLLTAKVADFSYSYDAEGNVSLERTGATKTILSEYFGISRYYGSIVEVNNDKPSAKVYVTKNVSNVNPTMLAVNQNHTFLSNGKVDMNFYKNIPVEIWADKDGMMVYIAPQPNVEVFYDVIYSVNNDTNPTNAYAINLVNKIEFNRDEKEYKIASGCEIRYNDEVVSYPVPLAGKYAKIVLIDNKVTFIETWNLQEGGLVTEINNSFVGYIKGGATGRLKNIGNYDDIIVVVEGRSTDRNQIKPGSLFYYYQTDNLLVIVVSEKTIVGNFDSISSGEIEIGRNFYPINGDVYCSEDGENFVDNDFDRIFDTQVICYVDIFGNIRYIKSDDVLKGGNEFTAYVIGYSQKGFEDTKLKLQKIYPTLEEVFVTLPADFTKYVDNPATTTYDETNLKNNLLNGLKWSERASAYTKLYKFNVNEEGVITKISEPDYFLLFGEAHTVEYMSVDTGAIETVSVPCVPAIGIPLDHFTGDYRAIYLADTKTNGISTGIGNSLSSAQLFYIRNDRFIILCNVDGKLGVREYTYNDMLARGPFNMTDVKIAMYGDEKSSQPNFWFIYGNTDKIYMHNSSESADVDSISQVYDSETGNTYYQVVLDNGERDWEFDSLLFTDMGLDPTNTDQVTHYRDPSAPPTQLEVGMRIHFKDGALFSDNGIIIERVEEFPKSADGSDMTIDQWHQTAAKGYLRGTVKKIDDYRIYMENGGMYHIGNNCHFTGVRFANGKVKYESISPADILAGSTIYFNRNMNVNSVYVELTD